MGEEEKGRSAIAEAFSEDVANSLVLPARQSALDLTDTVTEQSSTGNSYSISGVPCADARGLLGASVEGACCGVEERKGVSEARREGDASRNPERRLKSRTGRRARLTRDEHERRIGDGLDRSSQDSEHEELGKVLAAGLDHEENAPEEDLGGCSRGRA
jgi:hypothetical protein